MDDSMDQLLHNIIELEIEAEQLLLARAHVVENDKARNGNREALTALRKKAKTTKTSVVSSPFDSIMKDIGKSPLAKEICPTCGNHDENEKTRMMFPGADVFANQEQLDCESKKPQSYVKENSLSILEKGILADKISPGVLRSMVALTDKPKEVMPWKIYLPV